MEVNVVNNAAALVTLPAVVANVALATVPVTFAPAIADRFDPLPEKKLAVNTLPMTLPVPTLMLPLELIIRPPAPIVNPVNEPTEVMFGCAFVVSVPVIFVAPILPTLALPETDSVPVIAN